MIEEIARIVEEACREDSNMFGYGIWTHHIREVVKNGKQLAEFFGADSEIVEIAALLHDYASVKDPALYDAHHVHGPIEAEKILQQYNYQSERIEAVKECIAGHRGSMPTERRTPEAECLANADALTHIQQVPSLLSLAFSQRGMGIDDGTKWVKEKLKRSWQKLSPAVQEMTKDDYEAALKTLSILDEG